MIWCLSAQRVYLGREVKRQEIEGNPLLGDKILREEVIIGDMTDPNRKILIDFSHRMEEQEDYIENVRILDQDEDNMRGVNQETEVNRQIC